MEKQSNDTATLPDPSLTLPSLNLWKTLSLHTQELSTDSLYVRLLSPQRCFVPTASCGNELYS